VIDRETEMPSPFRLQPVTDTSAVASPGPVRRRELDRRLARLCGVGRDRDQAWQPTVREVAVLVAAMGLVWLAARLRTPLLASLRHVAIAVVIVVAIGLMTASVIRRRRSRLPGHAWRSLGFALSLLALFLGGARELAFQQARATVLHADRNALARIGAHVMVGYERIEEVVRLAERRAIAGVFVTARNVRGRGMRAVAEDVARLQQIRRSQQVPDLWIAADQEGGQVSRLSPPLPRPEPLSAVAGRSRVERLAHARSVAEGLARLGVNLNLAPIVDVDHGVRSLADRHTRIAQRAIAADVETIARVAGDYCEGLASVGVRCTLKHFPGLGRVRHDTHVRSATLRESVATLRRSDWVPFRRLMDRQAEVVMVGHVILEDVDVAHAASYSRPVIDGLLRGAWGYRGLLLTDDVCMAAIHESRDGIGGASVQALNAGVDMILVAYDPDQYWFVMQALLLAHRRGELDDQRLMQSRERLKRLAPDPWLAPSTVMGSAENKRGRHFWTVAAPVAVATAGTTALRTD
jgi:beta-N-acetylhexosaminidase